MLEPKKILLLDHPVSADQKAEARALGVRIVDAKFADQYESDQLYTPKKTRKAKAPKVEEAVEIKDETQEAGD